MQRNNIGRFNHPKPTITERSKNLQSGYLKRSHAYVQKNVIILSISCCLSLLYTLFKNSYVFDKNIITSPLLFQATGFQGKDKDYYWKFLSVVGGIYGFFIFETTAHLLLRQKHTVEVNA